MSIDVHGALDEARREAASRLLRAAIYFQTQHKARVGVSNPRPHEQPSRPGEYPRKRTGEGQGAIVYGRETLTEIAKDLKVRIGLRPAGKHMAILEFGRHRLGFLRTAADLESNIKAILQ